jgi:hypothetical protein
VTEIDPGRYSMSVTRAGYTRAKQNASKQNATPSVLTLSAGQEMKGISVKMVPQAVVTGRVVDEDNEPVSYASVSCMRYQYVSGTKTLLNSVGANTNDKGEFRMFGLEAGKCYISATLRQNDYGAYEIRKESGNEQAYVTTYYPSGFSPSSAIPVNVSAGGEVNGMDIRLMRAKTVHVSGTVSNLPAQANSVNVMLFRREGDASMSERRNTVVDPKGRFTLRDVGPGAYNLTAMNWQENQSRSATVLLDVGDSHIEGMQLTLGMDPEITGKLVTEGAPAASSSGAAATPAPAPSNVYLQPDAGMDFAIQVGDVKKDGTFVLKSHAPARYRLNVWPMPAGAYIRRVQVGDEEVKGGVIDFRTGVSAREITVTISLNGAQIEGVVRNIDQPSANASVVLIPSDSTLRNHYEIATSDQNGHYVMRGVAPGKYKLYAFDQIENGAYLDPDFLQPYENHGEPIEIAESAHETRDLKLILNEDASSNADTGKEL